MKTSYIENAISNGGQLAVAGRGGMVALMTWPGLPDIIQVEIAVSLEAALETLDTALMEDMARDMQKRGAA